MATTTIRKAADIPDTEFLAVVDRLSTDRSWGSQARRWVFRMEVEDQYPDVPWKILLAKARRLIDRGLMDGCPCGCRGDYHLTDAGLALLAEHAGTEVR